MKKKVAEAAKESKKEKTKMQNEIKELKNAQKKFKEIDMKRLNSYIHNRRIFFTVITRCKNTENDKIMSDIDRQRPNEVWIEVIDDIDNVQKKT